MGEGGDDVTTQVTSGLSQFIAPETGTSRPAPEGERNSRNAVFPRYRTC